jgi:hypothetical protein
MKTTVIHAAIGAVSLLAFTAGAIQVEGNIALKGLAEPTDSDDLSSATGLMFNSVRVFYGSDTFWPVHEHVFGEGDVFNPLSGTGTITESQLLWQFTEDDITYTYTATEIRFHWGGDRPWVNGRGWLSVTGYQGDFYDFSLVAWEQEGETRFDVAIFPPRNFPDAASTLVMLCSGLGALVLAARLRPV